MARVTSWLCLSIILLASGIVSPAGFRAINFPEGEASGKVDQSGVLVNIATNDNDFKVAPTAFVEDRQALDSPTHSQTPFDFQSKVRQHASEIVKDSEHAQKNKGTDRTVLSSQNGMVMVDAGSSGSKLFSFYPGCEEAKQKLLTDCTFGIPDPCHGSQCTEFEAKKKEYPLKGLSALGYKQEMCQAKFYLQDHPAAAYIRADVQIGIYKDTVLKSLKKIHEREGQCNANKDPPINQMAIPILATAGMRLLPPASQEKVWTSICGQGESGYTFADGSNCGTIPGTDEAYYEFLAGNQARANEEREPKEIPPVFTVTIGGESAQFGIPLKRHQLGKFAILYERVREVVNQDGTNCANIHLPCRWDPDGTITHFASGKAETPIATYISEDCARDFVDIREMPPSLKDDQFEYVGLISMLGLERLTGSIGIAGGMNAIEKWAKHNGCGAAEDKDNTASEHYDFAYFKNCEDKLDKALGEDTLYSAVKAFFASIPFWDDVNFIFGTPAVIPSWRYSDESVKDRIGQREESESNLQRAQAFSTLMTELDQQVKDHKNKRFGHGLEQTPMKTLYAYKYWEALGLDGWQGNSSIFGVMKGAQLAKRLSLYFDPVDWTKGKLAEMAEVASGKWRHARMDQSVFQEMVKREAFNTYTGSAVKMQRWYRTKVHGRNVSENADRTGKVVGEVAALSGSEPPPWAQQLVSVIGQSHESMEAKIDTVIGLIEQLMERVKAVENIVRGSHSR